MEHPPRTPARIAVGLWFTLSLACIGCGGGSSPSDAGIDAGHDAGMDASDPYAQFAAIVEAERQELGAPGVAIAVVQDGEITYAAGFGFKRIDHADPILTTTRFAIASVTKPLTAVGLLRLVDQGEVDLDAPVVDYVPQLHLTRSAALLPSMHVRHLLTHSTGLPHEFLIYTSTEQSDTVLNAFHTSQEFADKYSLMFPPGRMFFYSSPGFNLAGLVIERSTGQFYRDYMRDQVFEPLGMTRATFSGAELLADGDYAYPTRFGGLVSVSPILNLAPWQAPCGLAFASVLDVATFAKFLMDGNESVLSSEMHSAMTSPQLNLEVLGDRVQFGLGLFVYRGYPTQAGVLDHDFVTLEHGGLAMGTTTQMLVVPERRFAFVMITNMDDTFFDRSSVAALRLLEGLPEASLVQAPENPSMFARYAGTYQADTGFPTGSGEVTVTVDSSGLWMTLPSGASTNVLPPLAARNFVCPEPGLPFALASSTFLLDSGGNVEYLRSPCKGFVARRE